jgi:hypothetical protein
MSYTFYLLLRPLGIFSNPHILICLEHR